MTKRYKRGQNPRSLANLGKPKTKAGRFNFTLSGQSAEWLSCQKNKSAAIDKLIEEKIESEALVDSPSKPMPQEGDLSVDILPALESGGFSENV